MAEKKEQKEKQKGWRRGNREKKEPARKPKYGMLSCVGYVYKMLWKYERALVWVGILSVPVSLALAALGLYTPSVILNFLEKSDRFSTISLVILGLVLANLLLTLGKKVMDEWTQVSESTVLMQMDYEVKCRKLERDFYLNYDPEVRKLDSRARQALRNNHTEAVHFPMDFAETAAVALKFFLFGTVVSALNPWIILLLVLGSILNMPVAAWETRRNYETQGSRDSISKKLNYLSYRIGRDLRYGKDIRLYRMGDYLARLAERLLRAYRKEWEKVERHSLLVSFVGILIILVRDGVAYWFLISRAVAGELDAARFVLYFTAITELTDFVTGMIAMWSRIRRGALQISDCRECLEVRGSLNKGEGISVPRKAFSIELRNVTFRYPRGEKNVLEDVSFRVEAGERVALVGLNGAGKTTLTMLMCGLLLPTQGEVLLDGRDLGEYNRDELYRLFGLVPQDFHLLPLSIACNIACTGREDEIDREKMERCIRTAGLEEKIASLPLGADTPLNRQVNPEGTELSGGEVQKLLLARSLYRNPRCIILDEPTAALDPIAEDRMYRKYNEIAADATSVFISHRLASTRFCSRILLLDGAGIAESGTHDELVAAKGKYWELFEVQKKYYGSNAGGRAEAEGQEAVEK